MSNAPERIWAEPNMPGYLDEPNGLYTVEYVRADRVKELEAVLREVETWVDDLGLYAQEGFEPAPVFKRVKEVLSNE